MTEIVKNLEQVRTQIIDLARRYGRDADGIRLLAVSKTKSASAIREAFAAGQCAFGENYLQEALEKQQQLGDLGIEWHYIGRIQGNKTRPIAEHFQWVHGLDQFKHAQRLSEQRPEGLPPLNVCVQVNLSGEASKGGVEEDELEELAQAVQALPRLCLRGLMVLPAPTDSLMRQRQPFHHLAQLMRGLVVQGMQLDTLSMGMSADLEAAIAEGSTLVRVGTAIFGARIRA